MRVCEPNLPQGRVTLALANGLYDESATALKNLGVNVLTLGNVDSLGQLKNHTDLSFLHLSKNTAAIAREHREASIDGIKIFPIEKNLTSDYPGDVPLNCCIVGNRAICRVDSLSERVLKYLTENSFEIINVKQGYAKCSVAVVSENAIITEDAGIARACENYFDVLPLEEKISVLPGYDCGFLGGACGKIAKDTLAFNGDIFNNKIKDKIEAFTRSHGVYCVFLCDKGLMDIGGIIPLYEEDA